MLSAQLQCGASSIETCSDKLGHLTFPLEIVGIETESWQRGLEHDLVLCQIGSTGNVQCGLGNRDELSEPKRMNRQGIHVSGFTSARTSLPVGSRTS
jgi:hypothetical protein